MQPAFAGVDADKIVPFHFKLIPAHKPPELHDNIRSSVARKLPVVPGNSPANDLGLCVVGGGPSLADTIGEIRAFVDQRRGYVAAVNGALQWLLDHDVVPTMCGVCDPSPHMAGIVTADPRVTYFLASIVHPSVYDKLINAGCRIFRWNSSAVPDGLRVLDQVEPDWFTVGGGSTMGLRWLTLGLTLGFRDFDLHGFDSSFREKSSHAYPDHQDAKEWMNFNGYQTRPNFLGQVSDFIGWMDRLMEADVDPVKITVHGDGLLQSMFAKWKDRNPGCHEGGAKPVRKGLTDGFAWPAADKEAKAAILEDVKYMDQFLAYVPRSNIVVQAGGNVGVYPAHLAKRFQAVHAFEPDPANYACLIQNIETVGGNINAVNAALGERDGSCQLWINNHYNCGTTRVSTEAEEINGVELCEMRRIDGLDLHGCDLIWLDVEGYELRVLEGAVQTVEKFWPAVILEDNDTSLHHGIPLGAATEWLYAHGYISALKLGNDRLLLPSC